MIHISTTIHRVMNIRSFAGLLMIWDTLTERGMLRIQELWGPRIKCHFPLLSFVAHPNLEYFYILYAVLFSTALCITIGWKLKLSTITFTVAYWYLFILGN